MSSKEKPHKHHKKRSSKSKKNTTPKDVLVVPAFTLDHFAKNIHKFKAQDYADQFFRTHKVGIFKKQIIPVDELISYGTEPLIAPLLQSLPKSRTKDALQFFNAILVHTGVKQGRSISVLEMLNLLQSYPELRDEAFFQLIKQTRLNPDNEILKKTWELFLVVASIFPSSRNAENYILSHFAHYIDHDTNMRDIIKTATLRFESRCRQGKPLKFDLFSVKKLKDLYRMPPFFGSSVDEYMWAQAVHYPNLPIPYPLYQITKTLIEKKGLETEGLFRIPGRAKTIDYLIETYSYDSRDIDNVDVYELCSLLKRWLGMMSDTLVPENRNSEFLEACEMHKEIEFVNSLTKANQYSMKYLIGFLRECSEAEKITKMGASNLAICFAPSLISIVVVDCNYARKISEQTAKFIETLIAKLDTSEIYPLNVEIKE